MPRSGTKIEQPAYRKTEVGSQMNDAEENVCRWQEQVAGETFDVGTFGEVACDWLRFVRPQLKQSSAAKYINVLNLYLLPHFRYQMVGDIVRADITTLMRTLLQSGGKKGKGLSARTVSTILSVLKNIFDYSSRERNIRVADIGGIPIKQQQKPLRILSRTEQDRLSHYLCEDPTPCHLGILVCMYTGIRLGEICALKWEDISFDDHHLNVHKTMQRIQHLDSDDKRTEILIAKPNPDKPEKSENESLPSCAKFHW